MTLIGIIDFYRKIKCKFSLKKISNKPIQNVKNENNKYVLHGACLFLTDRFFHYYDGFFPRTFLYFEEFILKLMLNKVNGEMIYIEDTYIIHKEDRSSQEAFGNNELIKRKYEMISILWFLLLCFVSYDRINKF